MDHKKNNYFMEFALAEAKKAFSKNEVPVGCVIVLNNQIIGKGHNSVIGRCSVIAHAEIIAIEDASKTIHNYRLKNCDIYVTLEPCHMCAKAIVDARLNHLYYGAKEPKTGAIESIDKFLDREDINHNVAFSGGHMKDESSELLKNFFKSKRAKKASQKIYFNSSHIGQ